MVKLASNEPGFSLIELLLICSLVGIISAMAVPLMNSAVDSMRLGDATRQVERELQTARLTAVSANRPMRVRFNCSAAGQFRMVELVGTPATPAAADTAVDRCALTSYPYPAADRNALTRPNNDGPLRTLESTVSFQQSTTIEFWPDGSAHMVSGTTNPWPVIASPGTNIILLRKTNTRTIVVNGIGKVQLLP